MAVSLSTSSKNGLGPVEASLAVLGASCPLLGPSGVVFGVLLFRLLSCLGVLYGPLGPSLGPLGAILDRLGT